MSALKRHANENIHIFCQEFILIRTKRKYKIYLPISHCNFFHSFFIKETSIFIFIFIHFYSFVAFRSSSIDLKITIS